MRKTMAATAMGFFLAVAGGAAFANTNSGTGSASATAPSSGTATPQASPQNGAQDNAPVGFAEEEIRSAPLTVERVDTKNRKMVLRAPDGTQSTVDIPVGTPGFDSLKKGDQVQIDYVAAEVFREGGAQGNQAKQGASTSNSGSKASGSNNGIGRVHNIHKVDNSGNAGATHGAAQGSGTGQSKQ